MEKKLTNVEKRIEDSLQGRLDYSENYDIDGVSAYHGQVVVASEGCQISKEPVGGLLTKMWRRLFG